MRQAVHCRHTCLCMLLLHQLAWRQLGHVRDCHMASCALQNAVMCMLLLRLLALPQNGHIRKCVVVSCIADSCLSCSDSDMTAASSFQLGPEAGLSLSHCSSRSLCTTDMSYSVSGTLVSAGNMMHRLPIGCPPIELCMLSLLLHAVDVSRWPHFAQHI